MVFNLLVASMTLLVFGIAGLIVGRWKLVQATDADVETSILAVPRGIARAGITALVVAAILFLAAVAMALLTAPAASV